MVLFHIPLRPYKFPEADYTFEYITSELVSVLDELKMTQKVSLIGQSEHTFAMIWCSETDCYIYRNVVDIHI